MGVVCCWVDGMFVGRCGLRSNCEGYWDERCLIFIYWVMGGYIENGMLDEGKFFFFDMFL